MQGGDISNAAPQTLMVCLDCLVDTKVEETKKFFRTKTTSRRVLNLRLANQFYRQALHLDGVTFECFTVDGSPLDEWETKLDRLNINPFRYFTTYRSPGELASELAYRPNVVGVIDVPERAFTYGSKYMDANRLTAL